MKEAGACCIHAVISSRDSKRPSLWFRQQVSQESCAGHQGDADAVKKKGAGTTTSKKLEAHWNRF